MAFDPRDNAPKGERILPEDMPDGLKSFDGKPLDKDDPNFGFAVRVRLSNFKSWRRGCRDPQLCNIMIKFALQAADDPVCFRDELKAKHTRQWFLDQAQDWTKILKWLSTSRAH